MEKPITVTIFETKKAIAEVIQNSRLPIYIIEPIIKDLYIDIKNLNDKKLNDDLKEFSEFTQKKKGG